MQGCCGSLSRALGLGDHAHDPGEHPVPPDGVGAQHERTGGVEGAADGGVADRLGDRHGLSRDEGLVHRGPAVLHGPVDGDLLAGPHAQQVPDPHLVERDLLLGAVLADPACGPRGQVEERLERSAGRLAGPELQDLPQQDERGDDGGRLEVHLDGPVLAERLGEDRGCHSRDDGEQPGDAGAHRDQREHVQVTGPHGRRPADAEGPAGPEHDRRGQGELRPRGGRRGDLVVQPRDEVTAHPEDHDRDGQGHADPEATGHVAELCRGSGVRGDDDGLQRHPADGTGPGPS